MYRTISFNNQDLIILSFPDLPQVVFHAGFKHVNLTLRDTEAALNTYAGGGTTMGATVGDVVIAIQKVTALSQQD